jgi:hypothetical protein
MMCEIHPKTAPHRFVPQHAQRDDEPLDAWLKQQLGRDYGATLDEDVPEALLDLLRDMPPTRH